MRVCKIKINMIINSFILLVVLKITGYLRVVTRMKSISTIQMNIIAVRRFIQFLNVIFKIPNYSEMSHSNALKFYI